MSFGPEFEFSDEQVAAFKASLTPDQLEVDVAEVFGEIYSTKLINPNLVKPDHEILIFRLPYTDPKATEDVLAQVPYPVITIDRGLPSSASLFAEQFGLSPSDAQLIREANNQPLQAMFPADYGLYLDGRLHTSVAHKRILDFLVRSVGIEQRISGTRTTLYNWNVTPEGGAIVIDERGKRAVTSQRSWRQSLRNHGYSTAFLAPESVAFQQSFYPDDWVYQLASAGSNEFEANAHIDPLITLFSDKMSNYHTWVDEKYLKLAKVFCPRLDEAKPVDHEQVMQGVLNLAFLGNNVLSPNRRAMADLTSTLEDSGFNVIHFPESAVSQTAGLKCRTLVLPLGS